MSFRIVTVRTTTTKTYRIIKVSDMPVPSNEHDVALGRSTSDPDLVATESSTSPTLSPQTAPAQLTDTQAKAFAAKISTALSNDVSRKRKRWSEITTITEDEEEDHYASFTNVYEWLDGTAHDDDLGASQICQRPKFVIRRGTKRTGEPCLVLAPTNSGDSAPSQEMATNAASAGVNKSRKTGKKASADLLPGEHLPWCGPKTDSNTRPASLLTAAEEGNTPKRRRLGPAPSTAAPMPPSNRQRATWNRWAKSWMDIAATREDLHKMEVLLKKTRDRKLNCNIRLSLAGSDTSTGGSGSGSDRVRSSKEQWTAHEANKRVHNRSFDKLMSRWTALPLSTQRAIRESFSSTT